MPLYGDIRTFSFPAICRMIHAEKKTGVLKLKSGEFHTEIIFTKGMIAFINGYLTEDLSLGSLLTTGNLISEDKYQEAMKAADSSDKPIDAILTEQGYISNEKLKTTRRIQYKEVITKVLTWRQGEFSYSDTMADYLEDINMTIDPIRLLAEAQKWKEYRKLIPSDQVVFQIKEGALKTKSFSTEGVLRVLLLINGKRNVSQIINETGFSQLAVYKALVTLMSQKAIFREDIKPLKGKPDRLNHVTIINFYLNLLHIMIEGLTTEVGNRKAASLLLKSLRHPVYYDRFLCAFQPHLNSETNFRKIQDLLNKQSEKVSNNDLLKGFNHVVLNLLQEEFQLLGPRASINVISRVRKILETVPPSQKNLAENMINLLNQYSRDGDITRSQSNLSGTVVLDKNRMSDQSRSLPSETYANDGATVIIFFSQVVQILLNDLQEEIGTKSFDLFQNIIKKSKYYDLFLSQFDLQDTIDTSVKRIHRHIITKGRQLKRQELIQGFQQVIIALLNEEKKLLGDKTTQETVSHIAKYISKSTYVKHKSLAENLLSFLRNSGFRYET